MTTTDKFGRSWKFESGHDHNKMLRISPELAALCYNFDCAMKGSRVTYDGAAAVPNEPYLLKLPTGWVFGVRFSDEPGDYAGPGLDDRIIELMIEHHRQTCNDSREYAALEELFYSDPKLQLCNELMSSLRIAP